MKSTKGLWLTRKVGSGNVFLRLHTTQASTYKALPETWGIRLDLESDLRSCRPVM
jgi:hypothetical protein